VDSRTEARTISSASSGDYGKLPTVTPLNLTNDQGITVRSVAAGAVGIAGPFDHPVGGFLEQRRRSVFRPVRIGGDNHRPIVAADDIARGDFCMGGLWPAGLRLTGWPILSGESQ